MIVLSKFDQSRNKEMTSYGEAVRLSNALRSKPSEPITDIVGRVLNWSEPKSGFDVENADYRVFTSWLSDTSIKRSESLFWFVIRVMSWRFPEKHIEIRTRLAENLRLEFDLILSNLRYEVEWLGEVSYQNMVRLDGSLTNKNADVIKKNDTIKIKSK